ncbi:hypothetical protein AB5I41_24915 [Sphingomonas sp. MMS24-JH45]
MKNFQRPDINGVIGSTFLNPEGKKLYFERELGDDLLHVIELPGGTTHRVEDPLTGNSRSRIGAGSNARCPSVRCGGSPMPTARSPARERATLFDREYILEKDPFAEARLRIMLQLLEGGVDPSDPRLSEHIDSAWSDDLQEQFGERPPTSTVRSCWFGRC